MTTTTATKSLTVLEILGTTIKDGQLAKVTTDNDLYGTTVIKRGNTLINARTGEPLALTIDLLNTKFKLISPELRVTLGAFIEAYKAGKKVKVEVGERYRILQKSEDNVSEELNKLIRTFSLGNLGTAAAFTQDNIMTMEELTEGKFYIAE